ncbi:MAG TPA: hypothetical protein VIH88_03925 [Candidatus Acidoferrales bacterium]
MYSRTKSARVHQPVCSIIQPDDFCRGFLSVFVRVFVISMFFFVLIFPAALALRGQTGAAIGRVEGNDISVEGGAAASAAGNNGLPNVGNGGGEPGSFAVSSGSVVTVHVGQARMTLTAGGQIDICGPAKFTVLESRGAITLALNFGRMHVQIPATTSLRIYTPTIIATPLDIGGAVRDVNVGLDLNDSLCVVSTGGAVRLEQQFSGEGLIVPQAGEFFLEGGNLVPVVGAPGSCECVAQLTRVAPPPVAPARIEPSRPEIAQNIPPVPIVAPVVSQTQPAVAPLNVAVAEPTAPRYRVEIGELARANEMHPVAPASNFAPPSGPPEVTVSYTLMVQPLVVSVVPSPLRPAEPAADTALLVRVARVEPEWEFSGRVAAPEFAADMRRALGQTPVVPQPQPLHANQPAKKKRGFWGSLKSIFVGSDETRK